jgi:hypothetical protein
MPSLWRLTYRNRWRFFYLKYILLILFLTICLIINEKFNRKNYQLNNEENINHIGDVPMLYQNYQFNVTDYIPNWIDQYKISYLFNFYWLQTGGYKWHLEKMMNFKRISTNKQTYFHNLSYIFNYLYHYPEYGVIIDTASDPFQPLFSPLPRTSSSLNETCIHLEISNHWYPCYTKSEMISSFIFKPLITYGLYNIIIGVSSSEDIHYDEIIYLFDNRLEKLNETFFVTQILPRLIRLLALVPQTAVILSPYFNSKIKYVNQYIDILIQRGLLNDRKRLIKYNSQKSYHAYAVYSTSSPRSDLILLHHILMGNQSLIRRELILIIRNNLKIESYNEIVQTINQSELPSDLKYLHIHEYNEKSYSIKQISQLFRQALIVIGMPSHTLSHIVWCLPDTHIIEIGQTNMTTDYYDISLQLKLNYWLAVTTKTNEIDIIDFRNLIMRVFTYLHL